MITRHPPEHGGARPGAGRPPLDPNSPSRYVSVRMTSKDIHRAKEIARAAGLKPEVSAGVREAIRLASK